MPLEIRIGEEELTVTATETGGRYRLELGDETWEGRLAVREGCGLLLVGPNGPKEAWVARNAAGLWVWCDGRARLVEEGGAKRGRRRSQGARAAREVTPPMPAVVMGILVGEGDEVRRGQGLVVVSAMKMEMTLQAPFDGRVTAIHTTVGAKVNPGEILVDIAEDHPEGASETAEPEKVST